MSGKERLAISRSIREIREAFWPKNPNKVLDRMAKDLKTKLGIKEEYQSTVLKHKDDPKKGTVEISNLRGQRYSKDEVKSFLAKFYEGEGYRVAVNEETEVIDVGNDKNDYRVMVDVDKDKVLVMVMGDLRDLVGGAGGFW